MLKVMFDEMLHYLLEKQFPSENISICLIEQFGQTSYSPSMVLLAPRLFPAFHARIEDSRNEGILRYCQSISLCSAYWHQPELKGLFDQVQSISNTSSDAQIVTNIHQLLERDELTVRYKYSQEVWKYGYDHVPHRRWLFDRNRKDIKSRVTYHSPIASLIDHSNEHIYYDTNSSLDVKGWRPRNIPFALPTEVLSGKLRHFLTIYDSAIMLHELR